MLDSVVIVRCGSESEEPWAIVGSVKFWDVFEIHSRGGMVSCVLGEGFKGVLRVQWKRG